MAPSVAVSAHPYEGQTADKPANQEASLFTENVIYVAFYMGSCFLSKHIHARAHTHARTLLGMTATTAETVNSLSLSLQEGGEREKVG